MALVLTGGGTYADVPTLHRADGSKFTGDAAVQGMLPDYPRRTPEVIFLADGTRAFSQIGDAVGWIDGFRVDVFHKDAVTQIKSNIANETTQGLFQLYVPRLEAPGHEEFLIRFFDAPFAPSPETPRRRGNRQVFSAEIVEIEILGYESVA